MNLRILVTLCVVSGLVACGGGGGATVGGNGGNGDGGGSGGPTPDGSAEILFPSSHSGATGQTLTLRGTAQDPDGVAGVSVTGVAATIIASGSSSLPGLPGKPALAEGEVEWSAEVDLSTGENDLTVSVEDENGEVSEDADGVTVTWSEVPTSFSLDADNTRLVGLSYTLTPTGYRQRLVQHDYATQEQRSGIPLIVPRRFALTADGETAFVGDDGSNATARLFEIDLATGDRNVVGDINGAITGFITGLALDEAGNRVFVSGQNVIVEVDVGTGQLQTIADVSSSDLEAINGLVLDAGNNRLFVGDPASDAVFTLDLETHAIEVFSQEGVQGAGPAFGAVVSLTLDAAESTLYVAGQTSETVTTVDLATGDRDALVTGCDLGLSSTFQGLDEVRYSAVGNELIIRGDKFYSLDLATSECATMPLRVNPLQVATTPANQLLAVSFRVLMQIDRETGEVVVLAR